MAHRHLFLSELIQSLSLQYGLAHDAEDIVVTTLVLLCNTGSKPKPLTVELRWDPSYGCFRPSSKVLSSGGEPSGRIKYTPLRHGHHEYEVSGYIVQTTDEDIVPSVAVPCAEYYVAVVWANIDGKRVMHHAWGKCPGDAEQRLECVLSKDRRIDRRVRGDINVHRIQQSKDKPAPTLDSFGNIHHEGWSEVV